MNRIASHPTSPSLSLPVLCPVIQAVIQAVDSDLADIEKKTFPSMAVSPGLSNADVERRVKNKRKEKKKAQRSHCSGEGRPLSHVARISIPRSFWLPKTQGTVTLDAAEPRTIIEDGVPLIPPRQALSAARISPSHVRADFGRGPGRSGLVIARVNFASANLARRT